MENDLDMCRDNGSSYFNLLEIREVLSWKKGEDNTPI